MRRFTTTLLLILIGAVYSPSTSEARELVLETVWSGINFNIGLVSAGDDRLFVISQEGRVYVLRNGTVNFNPPFLDITDRVLYGNEPETEQGLLSVAFHPNFASNGYVFAAYTNLAGNGVVSRFQVTGANSDQAFRGSEVILLEVPQPSANHNLNQLGFGPDGHLYISSGDGGYQPDPRCTPQEPDTLLGKILRLDVDQNVATAPYYGIPSDNPFRNDPSVRDEIWAFGVRNAWRISWNPNNSDMIIADVGHNARDEINIVSSSSGGYNFGFPRMEGFSCTPQAFVAECSTPPAACNSSAYTDPVIDLANSASSDACAVIGGYVYDGNAIPQMQGAYVFGNYCGRTSLLIPNGGGYVVEDLDGQIFGMVSFGRDSDGELYIVVPGTNGNDGVIYKIVGLTGGTIELATDSVNVDETAGTVSVEVRRNGSAQGAASVDYATLDGSAIAGDDYTPTSGTLTWADGDSSPKTITVPILDDTVSESLESFQVRLSNAVGAGELGTLVTTEVRIIDDELFADCATNPNTHCFQDGRFTVFVEWRDFDDNTGIGTIVPGASDDSGLFWYFTENNWELLVKVLDACTLNDHYWVFFAATTNVEFTVRILDNETGEIWERTNPMGVLAQAVNDRQAFQGCE
ncbi:MAG: PQQ-dependent sugar dehydrogenase [Acidobacteriota bacterium]